MKNKNKYKKIADDYSYRIGGAKTRVTGTYSARLDYGHDMN